MTQVIELLATPLAQGILGGLAFLAGALMLYLSNKIGKRDERIKFLELKGTNVVLGAFCSVILLLFLLNPNDVLLYRQTILSALYIAMIVGGSYSIYQYKKY